MSEGPVPFIWPEIPEALSGLRNALASASGRVRISIAGKEYRLRYLSGYAFPFLPKLEIVLQAGGAEMVVLTDRLPRTEFFRDLLSGMGDDRLTPWILVAVLETALEGVLKDAERIFGNRIAIREIRQPAESSLDRGEGVDILLEAEDGQDPIRLRILAGKDGWEGFAGWLALAPKDPPRNLDHLPLQVRFTAAAVELPRRDVEDLEPGDIVLIDADPRRKHGIRISTDGALPAVCMATWDGDRIIVEEKMTIKASGDIKAIPDGDPFSGMEMELNFELGRKSATLGELREIALGSVFLLPENPEGRVDIRVNGRLLGTGSLVKISGRAGVRVESLWNRTPVAEEQDESPALEESGFSEPAAPEVEPQVHGNGTPDPADGYSDRAALPEIPAEVSPAPTAVPQEAVAHMAEGGESHGGR